MTPGERLQLQQLLQLDFWGKRKAAESPDDEQSPDNRDQAYEAPKCWELTRGIDLHPWQEQCVDQWFAAGKRGVLKVVTGAGKTILALAIAEKLQQTTAPDLCLAIVVPTIVLLDQWQEELGSRSN